MGALITYAGAIGCCALIVLFGPDLAEATVRRAGVSGAAGYETIATLIIFGLLLAVALVGGAFARINPFAPGRVPLRMAAIGAGIGVGGLGGAAGYSWVAGALASAPPAPTAFGLLLGGSLLILFMTMIEEVYFRGWLQPVLAARFGIAAAVLLSALAFAGLHLMGGARSPLTVLNLFLGGLLFGLLAARGGGIAGAVAAHFGWNWSEQILVGLDPNPGVGSFGALADFELSGPALWGGSDEGLNASLAMTIALLALLAPILILARARAAATTPAAPASGAAQA